MSDGCFDLGQFCDLPKNPCEHRNILFSAPESLIQYYKSEMARDLNLSDRSPGEFKH